MYICIYINSLRAVEFFNKFYVTMNDPKYISIYPYKKVSFLFLSSHGFIFKHPCIIGNSILCKSLASFCLGTDIILSFSTRKKNTIEFFFLDELNGPMMKNSF